MRHLIKKRFIIFLLFSFNFLSLFSIETLISPGISYTNYFLHTVYTHKNLTRIYTLIP